MANTYLILSAKEKSYSVANNTSDVEVTLKIYSLNSYNGYINQTTGTVTCNGSKRSFAHTFSKGTTTLYTGTWTVPHNSDGSKTVSYSAVYNASVPNYETLTASGSLKLTTIPRKSSVSATDANIESVSTITISKKSSSFTHTLTYSYSGLTGTITTKTSSSSVAWTVPASFYAKTPKKTGTVTITCTTYNGSTSIGSTTCTMTVTAAQSKCSPTVTVNSVADTNTAATALTGSTQKIIKGISNVKVNFSCAAKNSATIAAKVLSCNDGQTLNTFTAESNGTFTGTLNKVKGDNFKVAVTDSRGYVANAGQVLQIVDYFSPAVTVSAYRTEPTNNEIDLKLDGKWFNGSFGEIDNTLSVMYRYKATSSSTYTSWATLTVTSSGNTLTYQSSLGTNFTYTSAYDMQVKVADKLSETTYTLKVSQGIPVFDWGENDFNFNKPVTVDKMRGKNANGSWISGRDNAPFGNTQVSNEDSFYPVMTVKTASGSWDIGTLGTRERLYFSYTTDDNYNAGTNSNKPYYLDTDGTNNFKNENKILWSGAYYMNALQSITLSEAISAQQTGICLVFSYYSNGTPKDYNFSNFFVSKKIVELFNGQGHGHDFFMSVSSGSVTGAKYLYISDTSIKGISRNQETYTGANGITYTNTNFVLRYVIGV